MAQSHHTPEIKALSELLWEHQMDFKLTDKSTFYCGMGAFLNLQKLANAAKAYAHPDECKYGSEDEKYPPNGQLVIFVDTTVFGSGREGMYITEDEIYAKGLDGSRFALKLKDIKSIELDTEAGEITFNQIECFKYVGSSSDHEKMNIIVDYLKQYAAQFATSPLHSLQEA